MDLEPEMSVIREIPGYKMILKSVLKSQIQFLVRHLSDFGEEECCVLTASIKDGSLSQLGSNVGKEFLDSRTDLKAQFLSHCLSSQHKAIPCAGVSTVNNNKSSKMTKMNFNMKRPSPYRRQITQRLLNREPVRTELSHHITKTNLSSDFVINKGDQFNQSLSKDLENGVINKESQKPTRINFDDTTGNQSNLKFHEYVNELCETGSHTVMVKQEPVDEDFCAVSWTPDTAENLVSGTSQESEQGYTGYQAIQSTSQKEADSSDLSDDVDDQALFEREDVLMKQFKSPTENDTRKLKSKSKEQWAVKLLNDEGGVSPISVGVARSYGNKMPCELCSKLISVQNMKKHLIIHSGIRKFGCRHCERRFSQRPDLRRHMRQLHKDCEEMTNDT